MSWDDEDFDIPSKAPANVASASWEDEEDDDPVLESWDIDEEEVARKKKEDEDKKNRERAELKKKQDEAKIKKLNAKKGIRGVLDVDELDDDVRKELMKEEALRADLNNTADLFGGLGVSADDALEHPKERLNRAILAAQNKKPVLTKDTPLEEHPLFQPTNKQEYENLRKGVGSALTKLADDSILNYSSSLAIDLIRDLTVPLSVENLRKVISTLNVAIKDKEKAERLARLKKSGGTATGGAGKKKAKPAARPNVGGGFMKDGLDEMDNYDDFGDDDFM